MGMNSWVFNRDFDTFGIDSDEFVPERWLQASGETDEQFQARLTKVQRAILTFGAGPRVCIGKNFSEVESDVGPCDPTKHREMERDQRGDC